MMNVGATPTIPSIQRRAYCLNNEASTQILNAYKPVRVEIVVGYYHRAVFI